MRKVTLELPVRQSAILSAKLMASRLACMFLKCPTGAAKAAGIKKGDVITKINDAKVSTIEQVQNKVNNTKAGTEITVTISRSQDGEYKEQNLKVTLKGSETLNELDNGSQDSGNSSGSNGSSDGSSDGNSSNPYGNDSYDDSYGSQIMPW